MPTESSAAADKTVIAPLLRELYVLVANDNLRAVEVLESVLPLLSGAEYSIPLGRLRRTIRGYDFDEAVEALRELAVAVGIGLEELEY